jgi:HEPN domain-containing protein
MTNNRNASESQRWLRQALHDRDAAEVTRAHGFHEHACFLAQQSAEKALKAFLYARGEGPVLGHSTLSLALECAALQAEFATLQDACRRLDQLYIPTRYPNGLPDTIPHDFYNDTLAGQALADLEHVLACVQQFVVARVGS